ncbi:sulfatase family protein [Sphingomonas sp. PAMC 26605]|uniref:sulfatase family protein n=1 Tax=Sphingomonas sp. PAMC 26605 TaxID=1112214 RepID=UPI00026CD1FE|nr:sulfatase [Sphingomonas sp. PAMC 26605]
MRKREFLTGTVLTTLAATLPAQAAKARPPASAKRMNVLIITVDDMDVSMPGYMGNKHGLTPNLDALALRSHVFENCRGAAPICMPSREAFMSGLVPHRNGPGGFDPMYQGTPSLCSILTAAGWYSAASHKLAHMQPRSSFPWDDLLGGGDRNVLVHAAEFNRAVANAKARSAPFFINCNINDPHRPFYGSPGGLKKDHNNEGPFRIPRELGPDDVEVPPFLEDLPDIRTELSQYSNSVQRADIAIGQILRALKDSGEESTTIVLFCNDHGMPFPFSKATGYEHGTRVPALLHYPGMSTPRRFSNLCCNVDIMPTVLDLLELPVPGGIDGTSWLPRMRGEKVADPEFIITYVNGVANGQLFPVRTIQDHQYALLYQIWSDGERKLTVDALTGLTFRAMVRAGVSDPKIAARAHQYQFGIPISFYDKQADPGQRVNLIDASAYQARIARMRDAMLAEMVRTKDPQLENVRTMIAGGKPVVGPGAHRVTDEG